MHGVAVGDEARLALKSVFHFADDERSLRWHVDLLVALDVFRRAIRSGDDQLGIFHHGAYHFTLVPNRLAADAIVK